MIVTHQLTIDLLERKSIPQIEATQNDRLSRKMAVSLLSGERTWQVPQYASVVIRYYRSDGTGGEYDTLPDGSKAWYSEGNTLHLTMAPQVFEVPGNVMISPMILQADKILTVFSVVVTVHPLIQGEPGSAEPFSSITGFLPAPESAEVGKFLRVAEVDDSGKILALDTATVSGEAVQTNSEEPERNDIPKVYFGQGLPQTKDEAVMSFLYSSGTTEFSGWCKTKAQGNTSMNFPKKNQTVKLYRDSSCAEKLKMDFKGWGKENKFCFKANWIDLSHVRNVVSARLWGDVVRSRDRYLELPELYRNSPNQGAVDGFPVQVYAQGVYQGRYTLNIPKDPWMAGMDDNLEEHCILCGENYGSGCFRAAAKIDGSDWSDEVHDAVPAAILQRWNEVIDFVRNSSDAAFRANIEDYFYLDSLIDYHLFGLISCGLDAYGKNQLYMTYNGSKWIAGMYDMDATWGLWWDGATFVANNYDRSQYQDFKDGNGNLLYIRLEQCFYEEIQARWAQLRSGALSMENILLRFERFTDIVSKDLVAEDYAATTANGAFTRIPSKTSNNIQQIRSFVAYRHGWCDSYVASLTPGQEVRCTGIEFASIAMVLTVGDEKTLSVTVSPAGCTEEVVWSSSAPGVLKVSGGVVTAIAPGTAVVSAVCGDYSASIDVSVKAQSVTVSCTGITLSQSSLSFTGVGSQTLTATVLPEGCTDSLSWETSNSSVAVVRDGVVTAIGDGEAVITAICGTKSAQCYVSVTGLGVNLLGGLTWHVGEVSESTGAVVETVSAANYTDAFDISAFANTILRGRCTGCNTLYSRVVIYDENMAMLKCIGFNVCGTVPANAKYARISVYSGAGKTLEIVGSPDNLWNTLTVNDGSYANGQYNPNDSTSCYIRTEVAAGDVLASYGAWGVAYLDASEAVLGSSVLTNTKATEFTVPDGAVWAVISASDSNLANTVCNRMETVAASVIA